jgi:hypothetical protein
MQNILLHNITQNLEQFIIYLKKNNKLIFILVLLFLILIYLHTYTPVINCNKEFMKDILPNKDDDDDDDDDNDEDDADNDNKGTAPITPMQDFFNKFIETPNLINLKYTIANKIYYLTMIPKSLCINITDTSDNECSDQIAVLAEQKYINESINKNKYMLEYINNLCKCEKIEKCILKKRNNDIKLTVEEIAILKDKNKNLLQSGSDSEKQFILDNLIIKETYNKLRTICNIDYEHCNYKQLFNSHDLKLIKKNNSDIPIFNIITKNIDQDKIFYLVANKSNKLCFVDDISTKNSKLEFVIVNKSTQIPGIIGGQSSFKIIIKFSIKSIEIKTVSIANSKSTTDIKNEVINSYYVGKCDTSQICSSPNYQFIRLCLYSDKNDPNIINFEPNIKT